MTRLASTVALVLLLLISSYRSKDIENEKFLNFLAAIENQSTFNYFTVIKVKDLNTGLVKEICTKGNFLSGALHIELKADYDSKGEQRVLNFAKSKRDRYFEFKSKKALDNISFSKYNSEGLAKIQTEFDFDKIAAAIKRDNKYSIRLPDNRMPFLAHALFNRGILSGESACFGGTLEYVDRTKSK